MTGEREHAVAQEREAQLAREQALGATAARRGELDTALRDLDSVLPRINPGPDLATLLIEQARQQARPAAELDRAAGRDLGLDLGL
jgi:hypothetical protein